MSVKIEEIVIPTFTRNLRALGNMLEKGESYASNEKIDLEVLVGTKVADSMHPLGWQVQKSTSTVVNALSKLGNLKNDPIHETKESYTELQKRVALTYDFVLGFDATKLEGAENRIINLGTGSSDITQNGITYLMSFALPNFYFHLAGTFNILRRFGVKINKLDFLGEINQE